MMNEYVKAFLRPYRSLFTWLVILAGIATWNLVMWLGGSLLLGFLCGIVFTAIGMGLWYKTHDGGQG